MSETKRLFKMDSYGSSGHFGLEILVSAKKLPDLEESNIRRAVGSAVKLIESAVREEIISKDEKTLASIVDNRSLVDIFNGPIFVEETPNGYCSDWCCKHLPWFVVTTEVGRIKIGWRKRVIEIDWIDTVGTEFADVLFEDEDVTKFEKSIHAWSVEDAKRYVETIIQSAE